MSLWTFDRAGRLAEARDHCRAILAALRDCRCELVAAGQRWALPTIDARIAATEGRYRCLCRLARSERRRVATVQLS